VPSLVLLLLHLHLLLQQRFLLLFPLFFLVITTLPCSLFSLLPLSVSMTVCTMVAAWPRIWPELPPEGGDELEGRAQLHAQATGQVGLGEQGQAPAIQLVIQKHLFIFTTDLNLLHKLGHLLHAPGEYGGVVLGVWPGGGGFGSRGASWGEGTWGYGTTTHVLSSFTVFFKLHSFLCEIQGIFSGSFLCLCGWWDCGRLVLTGWEERVESCQARESKAWEALGKAKKWEDVWLDRAHLWRRGSC